MYTNIDEMIRQIKDAEKVPTEYTVWTKTVENGQVIDRVFTPVEIANIKAEKIKWIKAKAAEAINNVAPVWKQMNLLRAWVNGGTKDTRFDQIDAIRTKSDQLEAQVNAATTVTEINAVVW